MASFRLRNKKKNSTFKRNSKLKKKKTKNINLC